MARISPAPPRTIGYQIWSWLLRRGFGEMPDPFPVHPHNMPAAQGFGQPEQSAAKWTRLDPELRDLADMAAAITIGCPWCMDLGYWVLHSRGIPVEKLEAISDWRTSSLFDPLERLVIEYAEAMTETPLTVDHELVEQLKVHLDDAQLVELTAIVCLENGRSRFSTAAGPTRQKFKHRCEVTVGPLSPAPSGRYSV